MSEKKSDELKRKKEYLLDYFDCILKHLPSAEILLIETIEKAKSKGRDTTKLSENLIHLQSLSRRIVSRVLPSHPTIAEIPNIWRCIGWLNTGSEHLVRGGKEYASPETDAAIVAIRQIRKNLLEAIVDDILKEEKEGEKQNEP